jgi:hypothetical protein
MTSEPSRDYVVAALENAAWTFARTMPQTPHFYTLRKAWNQPVGFEDVVLYIREHGVRRRFGNTTYVYLDHGDWQYWTMGAHLAATILINRAKIAPSR